MRCRAALNLVALLLLAIPVAGVAQSAVTPVLVGKVIRITDGDTIHVQLQSGPIIVRLDSIDAPESTQPHGGEAAAALAAWVQDREVQLEVVSQDKYERLLAIVHLGDVNINEQLVRQGHAWAYRFFLRDPRFCDWEGAARDQRLGLWALPQSDWIFPFDWRRLQNLQIQQPRDYSKETVAACKSAIGPQGRPSTAASP